jgi:hypothetical protein
MITENMTVQSLTQMVNTPKFWPTPRAGKTSDENEETWMVRHQDGKVATPPLALAVKMYPTPCATDHKGAGVTGTLRDRLDYAIERGATKSNVYDGGTQTRQTYPTPCSRDHKNATAAEWDNKERTRNLNRFLAKQGEGSDKKEERLGQLNPSWVEWLMNWPIGWSSLDSLPESRFRAWLAASKTGLQG